MDREIGNSSLSIDPKTRVTAALPSVLSQSVDAASASHWFVVCGCYCAYHAGM